MTGTERFGIIGSGASGIYVLKHLLERLPQLTKRPASIRVFERDEVPGIGMPYHPRTTDIHNLCNISSREIPLMVEPLHEWLRSQPKEHLEQWGVRQESIDEGSLYPRLALGAYFRSQFERLCQEIREQGIEVVVTPACEIVDVVQVSAGEKVTLISSGQIEYEVERLFICTGHSWPDEDAPQAGYYSSPWPIAKILPKPGQYFGFRIGLLGASLSAFDVVTSLAHRHGRFLEQDGPLKFVPASGVHGFKICLHTKAGRLPQLQFEQVRPLRNVYRHISREDLLNLRDDDGWLRLKDYFGLVCRPLLAEAFRQDQRGDVADFITAEPGCSIDDFVEKMALEHDDDDPFEKMREELSSEERRGERPLRWKEILDDLMYTLNFHVELLPAEDHQKLTQVVMPFLLNVMAAMPLPSARILLALREAGCIEIVQGAVSEISQRNGETVVMVAQEVTQKPNAPSETEHCYRLFVDCSGQKPIDIADYPFPSLVESSRVRRARAAFANPVHVDSTKGEEGDLRVDVVEGCPVYYTGGLDVDANYRVIDRQGRPNGRVYELSFPHTAGVRPYSYGLQACDETAALAVRSLLESID